ncbi:MAG: penicillin-binding protein [Patescibacteria group bacterium]|nr:penicillin-binding protein [Patescibacteria group bacterium]
MTEKSHPQHHPDTPEQKPKKKRSFMPHKKAVPKFLLTAFLAVVVIGLMSLSVFLYFFIFRDLPNPNSLRDFKAIPISTHIYDRNGKLLYEIFSEQNRTPVRLESLPKYVAQATIAVEDKDFYRHSGVSIISGVLRAIKDTYLTNQLQGGSTLTQQLVKSALLSPERTVQRKAKEIVLALWAERIFSKDEILELYLNQVPYGGEAYGVEEASKKFFGKSATEITLPEAALLAGLPQAPSLYSPYLNPELAKSRRNDVLDRMVQEGYITADEGERAKASPIEVQLPKVDIKAPHFVFYVKKELEELYGKELVEEGGLRVTTTLDLDIQASAEAILREEIAQLKNLNVTNGALLVTRPPTGEILAMVGSVDYFATPSGAFNVTTANRQPGSTIKPINYAIGIDRKIVTASSVFLDVQTCFDVPGQVQKYCPRNYDGKFHGPVGLRYALANSYNIPAVKMMAYNGVSDFIASAEAFMINSFQDPSRYGLSLTLGGGEMKMTEMAQAFSAFPNRGRPKKLQSILKIEDKTGKTLATFVDPNFVADVKKPLKSPNFFAMRGPRAIKEGTAFIISHILQDNQARSAAFGTNSELVIKGKTVSVKTGTTDSLKDNWTIGFTPNFLTVVWVGNNDNTPMNQNLVSGVTGAAPIWNRVMTMVLENQPDLPPVKPDGVIGTRVCTTTGVAASVSPGCATRFEYLLEGTEAVSLLNVGRASVPVTRDTDVAAAPGDPNVEMKEKTVLRDKFSSVCLDCARQPPPN